MAFGQVQSFPQGQIGVVRPGQQGFRPQRAQFPRQILGDRQGHPLFQQIDRAPAPRIRPAVTRIDQDAPAVHDPPKRLPIKLHNQ